MVVFGRAMGRLSVRQCGVGSVGVSVDLAVWALARGLAFLTDLKLRRKWLRYIFFVIRIVFSSPFPIIYDNVSLVNVYICITIVAIIEIFVGVEASGLLLNLLLYSSFAEMTQNNSFIPDSLLKK